MPHSEKIAMQHSLKKFMDICRTNPGCDIAAASARDILLDCVLDYRQATTTEGDRGILLYQREAASIASFSDTSIIWDQLPFDASIELLAGQPVGLLESEYAVLLSNLSFDWLDAGQFIRMMQVLLAPAGVFWFTSYGPRTAMTSREILSALDQTTHFNDYYELQDIGDALLGAGFEHVALTSSMITLEYTDFDVLLADSRRIFGLNQSAGRRNTLGGRGVYRAFKARVEQIIQDQGVFAEQVEIVVAHGRQALPPEMGGEIPVRMG